MTLHCLTILPSATLPSPLIHIYRCNTGSPHRRTRLTYDPSSPVNKNGSFDYDRVIKCGLVRMRTQKTKTWKPLFLVLRPNTLFIYKTEMEDQLRHKICVSDLTAVTFLKDPKHKRKNVFGVFSPSRNFHFQALSSDDAREWVELISRDGRIDPVDEEPLFTSPTCRRPRAACTFASSEPGAISHLEPGSRLRSSSPEPFDHPHPHFMSMSPVTDSSSLSGTEQASHSDFSDADSAASPTLSASHAGRFHPCTLVNSTRTGDSPDFASVMPDHLDLALGRRSSLATASGIDLDRVMWQGRLRFLRSKGGVRQWKDSWAVLRPRNLILYKDESEYSARFIVPMSAILDVVDIDPVSRTKRYCLQIITAEKSYRLCARDEDSLVQCLGAFKCILTKRPEPEPEGCAVPGP